MTNKLMECGHTANATFRPHGGAEQPCCAICIGITKGAEEVVPKEKQPDLTNRIAKCVYCRKVTSSELSLPFFEYKPARPLDWYYCGCRGWD